jgi:hypothetical protein
MEELRASPDFQKLLAMQEHPTSRETCGFIKHEVARILPHIYPDLYNGPIAGGFIRMSRLDDSHYILMADLFNPVADIYVLKALHKLDVDVPCYTVGDIVNEKLNVISADSLERYGESHKNQILEWLAVGHYDNMFVNEDLIERVKRAAGRWHDGGAS